MGMSQGKGGSGQAMGQNNTGMWGQAINNMGASYAQPAQAGAYAGDVAARQAVRGGGQAIPEWLANRFNNRMAQPMQPTTSVPGTTPTPEANGIASLNSGSSLFADAAGNAGTYQAATGMPTPTEMENSPDRMQFLQQGRDAAMGRGSVAETVGQGPAAVAANDSSVMGIQSLGALPQFTNTTNIPIIPPPPPPPIAPSTPSPQAAQSAPGWTVGQSVRGTPSNAGVIEENRGQGHIIRVGGGPVSSSRGGHR